MLGKLLKYDLRYIYKQLLIFYGIVVVLAVVGRLADGISDNFLVIFIHEFCQGATLGFSVGLLINATMRSWERFKKNLYGDESYLTHTLPIRRSTIWTAKFLASIITAAISIVVITIALLILFGSPEYFDAIAVQNHGDITSTFIMFTSLGLTIMLQVIYIIQSGFMGIILGHRVQSRRNFWLVLIGFLVYITGGIFLMLGILIWSTFDPQFSALLNSATQTMPEIIKLLSGINMLYIIIVTGTYFINRKLLDLGVNVD